MLRRRLTAVIARQVGRDLILLDTESNHIHQLNETAGYIWHKCDQVRSSDEIARLLATEYEISYGSAVSDVAQTLETLQELNLVVEVDSSDGLPDQNTVDEGEDR
jgi:coenzyme PQQ synthesis protein D (PqqD)